MSKDFYNSRDVRVRLHGKAEPLVIDAIASCFELINATNATLQAALQTVRAMVSAGQDQETALRLVVNKMEKLAKAVNYDDHD